MILIIIIIVFVVLLSALGVFIYKTQRKINEIRNEKIDKAVERHYKRNIDKAKRDKRRSKLDQLLEDE